MAQHDLDADIHKNRLLQEIDAAITEVNRVKIKATAGSISQEQMLRVAVAVSGCGQTICMKYRPWGTRAKGSMKIRGSWRNSKICASPMKRASRRLVICATPWTAAISILMKDNFQCCPNEIL